MIIQIETLVTISSNMKLEYFNILDILFSTYLIALLQAHFRGGKITFFIVQIIFLNKNTYVIRLWETLNTNHIYLNL